MCLNQSLKLHFDDEAVWRNVGLYPMIYKGYVFCRLQWFTVLVNSLLSGSFLIKFSSLSAPTKIEELTAGSDEKAQAGKWEKAGKGTGGAALCFFVWSGCQFFYLCRSWKRREFGLLFWLQVSNYDVLSALSFWPRTQICTRCQNASMVGVIFTTLGVGLALFALLLYWNWSKNTTTSLASFFFYCQVRKVWIEAEILWSEPDQIRHFASSFAWSVTWPLN